jgi:hypothetical protein
VAVAAADPVASFDQFRAEPTEARFGSGDPSDRLASGSGSGRYQFWTAAVDAFAHDPLTGIGAGGYEAWWNQNGTIVRAVRDAHSLFFETLGELGLPGLLLIVSFVAIGVTYGWRRRAGGSPGGTVEVALALLAAGVYFAATDWTWEIPAAFGPVVIAIGLLTGPATMRRAGGTSARSGLVRAGSDGQGPDGPSQRSFGWGVATLLVGWAAVWAAGILFLTEVKLDDSRTAVDRGDLVGAAQDASDASTLQPWGAEPKLQLALVEERAGDLPAARRAIREAIDAAPEDWAVWRTSSRIEEGMGNREAARDDFERARALNPRAPVFTEREGSE